MENHDFIFSPGRWLGEGKIQLNMVEEDLAFFTRWKIEERASDGLIECTQEIQVKGLSDVMINQFVFSNLEPKIFSVLMENYAVGKVAGKGFINEKMIGWEFRVKEIGFEGFEFYEKQTDELYNVHGEFSTSDDLRTTIHGKIWRQKAGVKE
jgi:hypothetical protein